MSLVRYGSWRWMIAAALASLLSLATFFALRSAQALTLAPSGPSSQAVAPAAKASPTLSRLAAGHPGRQVEVIVQLRAGTTPTAGRALVRSTGGTVTQQVPIINGLGADMTAGAAKSLAGEPGVRSVSLNARIKSQAVHPRRHGASVAPLVDSSKLASAYDIAGHADKAWASGYTGAGVGVAVLDTGIQGNLPDFRVSQSDPTSRVIATAVANPGASTAGDSFGHGTHIAGIIAGNGDNRPSNDPLYGRYIGIAPQANLISVKVSDEQGNASVLDVIDGLQFIVDHKADYNIRVANLSLSSTDPQSYKTDPLDAAVEQAWNSGITVVTAAGNRGLGGDSVSYAPGNDPYAITVGGVDDHGTKTVDDDTTAPWSSQGTTQDGFAKPDLMAPGAHIVSTIPPGSVYTQLCPSCVTDGSYFRVGGTSMAAAVVSGEAADVIQAYPSWNPNQVKAQIIKRSRDVTDPTTSPNDNENAVDKAVNNPLTSTSNTGLTPNSLIDPSTGLIDFSRASWSRASWSDAVDPLRASWSRASWSRASWSRASWSATPQSCSDFERASWSRASWSSADIQTAKDQCSSLLQSVDPTRASWSRASWSRASWSSAFDK
jgi:serine protease AprX